MNKFLQIDLSQYFTADRLEGLLRAAVIVVLGLLLGQVLSRLVTRVVRKRLSPQAAMLVRKGIFYSIAAIVIVSALQALGLQIGALLGAAGIVGIAIGFASQTSMSNLISGIFLISEKPFSIGDVVSIGGTTGIVQSIDLLSVKIRKFDNQYVRIPNEKIITNELTNITRYPIRRLDLHLGVAYKEDLARVREVLLDVAEKNPYALIEPPPLIIFNGFGDSSIDIMFGLWFEKSDFLNLKNSMMIDILKRFGEEGIEIPFPHRTIYTGAVTEPFPIEVKEPEARRKRGRRGVE